MLSKIQIDLDQDNRPVVTIQVKKNSDDIRDKVAQRFIESINGAQAVECYFEDIYNEDTSHASFTATGIKQPPVLNQKLVLRPFQGKNGLHNVRQNIIADLEKMVKEVDNPNNQNTAGVDEKYKQAYRMFFSEMQGLIQKHFSVVGEMPDVSFEDPFQKIGASEGSISLKDLELLLNFQEDCMESLSEEDLLPRIQTLKSTKENIQGFLAGHGFESARVNIRPKFSSVVISPEDKCFQQPVSEEVFEIMEDTTDLTPGLDATLIGIVLEENLYVKFNSVDPLVFRFKGTNKRIVLSQDHATNAIRSNSGMVLYKHWFTLITQDASDYLDTNLLREGNFIIKL